jgi:hypothetical protein
MTSVNPAMAKAKAERSRRRIAGKAAFSADNKMIAQIAATFHGLHCDRFRTASTGVIRPLSVQTLNCYKVEVTRHRHHQNASPYINKRKSMKLVIHPAEFSHLNEKPLHPRLTSLAPLNTPCNVPTPRIETIQLPKPL